MCNNGFDDNIEDWITDKEKPISVIPHNNDMFTITLEKGKNYKIEYMVVANDDKSMINVLPTKGIDIVIDNIQCVEIVKDENKEKEKIPKGMSPSFHHLMQKQRKKKGIK